MLIPQKGNISNLKNYRPITCLSTCYKLFTRILYARLLIVVNPILCDVEEQRRGKKDLSGPQQWHRLCIIKLSTERHMNLFYNCCEIVSCRLLEWFAWKNYYLSGSRGAQSVLDRQLYQQTLLDEAFSRGPSDITRWPETAFILYGWPEDVLCLWKSRFTAIPPDCSIVHERCWIEIWVWKKCNYQNG